MVQPEREGYVLLGKVSVDSGQLIVCDPSYVLPSRDGTQMDYDVTTDDVFEAVKGTRSAPLITEPGKQEVGLTFRSGYGDDTYPVFGKYDANGRIVEVVIDMQMTPVQKQLFGVR